MKQNDFTLQEVEETIILMRRRLETGQGFLHTSMCRLSLPMSEFLLTEAKNKTLRSKPMTTRNRTRFSEAAIEDTVRLERAFQSLMDSYNNIYTENKKLKDEIERLKKERDETGDGE